MSLVHHLLPHDLKKLQAFLAANPKLLAAFEKYRSSTKPIDLIANLGFGGFTKRQIGEFPHTCEDMLAEGIDAGLTMDDVLARLCERELDSNMSKLPNQATLQLVSVGHEVRGDRFLYRQYRILGF